MGTTTVTAGNQAFLSGGTNSGTIARLLTQNGVPSAEIPSAGVPAIADMETPLSQGRGVIAPLDVTGLPGWGTQSGGHAVTVTGIEYDDAGNITAVIYNDTGIGVCQQRATPAQFQAALNTLGATSLSQGRPLNKLVATNNPVWFP